MLPAQLRNRQNIFLKGKGIERYGSKAVEFNNRASTGIGRYLIKTVGKLQAAILKNINRQGSISSGNLYQSVGGSLKEEIKPSKISVYMQVPRYTDYIDKGVKGAKSSYASSRNSPYKYTNKRPPLEAMKKHLSMKYGTPSKELYFKSKMLQDKIFKKGIKGTGVVTKAYNDKFRTNLNQGVVRILKDEAIISILEL
jgi:hypothetical protein